jgi:hypothetical protein
MLHRHSRGRQQLPLTYDSSRDYYSYSKTYKPKKRRSLLGKVLLYGGLAAIVSVCVCLSDGGGGGATRRRARGPDAEAARPPPSSRTYTRAHALQLLLGYWLSTPILKAVRTTRTPDHESEQYYNLADGCVVGSGTRPCGALSARRRRRPVRWRRPRGAPLQHCRRTHPAGWHPRPPAPHTTRPPTTTTPLRVQERHGALPVRV